MERGSFSPCDREAEQRLLGHPLPGGGAAHLVPTTGDRGRNGARRSCVVPLVPESSRTHVTRGTRVTRHTSAATRPAHTPASAPRFAPPRASNIASICCLPRAQHATANHLGKLRHVNTRQEPGRRSRLLLSTIATSSSFDLRLASRVTHLSNHHALCRPERVSDLKEKFESERWKENWTEVDEYNREIIASPSGEARCGVWWSRNQTRTARCSRRRSVPGRSVQSARITSPPFPARRRRHHHLPAIITITGAIRRRLIPLISRNMPTSWRPAIITTSGTRAPPPPTYDTRCTGPTSGIPPPRPRCSSRDTSRHRNCTGPRWPGITRT